MNNLDRIESAYKTFKRGGDFLQKVFKKQDRILTPEECLKLKDFYGIRLEDVVKIAISHEFSIDKEAVAALFDQDEIKMKTVQPLCR